MPWLWLGRSVISSPYPGSFCNLIALRTSRKDDAKSTRTPSSWMISPASLLARGQNLFLGWVSLNEQKWVILAERRGFGRVRDLNQQQQNNLRQQNNKVEQETLCAVSINAVCSFREGRKGSKERNRRLRSFGRHALTAQLNIPRTIRQSIDSTCFVLHSIRAKEYYDQNFR